MSYSLIPSSVPTRFVTPVTPIPKPTFDPKGDSHFSTVNTTDPEATTNEPVQAIQDSTVSESLNPGVSQYFAPKPFFMPVTQKVVRDGYANSPEHKITLDVKG